MTELTAPIGLFDSGLGGLSVYAHLHACMPNEQFIYYADTLNVPYGARSSADIIAFTHKAVEWLIDAGCKLIVIACNSASAHALQSVRAMYPTLPIVGLVPALKPAVLASQSKNVAVLATKATLEGYLLQQVIATFAIPNGVNVIKCFDAELVPWVESGMPKQSPVLTRLQEMLLQWSAAGVDYLVLGCTHYPFFRPLLECMIIQNKLNITVVDSGSAIARRVQTLLSQSLTTVNFKDDNNPSTIGANAYDAVIEPTLNIKQNSSYVTKPSNTLMIEIRDSLINKKLPFIITNPHSNQQQIARIIHDLVNVDAQVIYI